MSTLKPLLALVLSYGLVACSDSPSQGGADEPHPGSDSANANAPAETGHDEAVDAGAGGPRSAATDAGKTSGLKPGNPAGSTDAGKSTAGAAATNVDAGGKPTDNRVGSDGGAGDASSASAAAAGEPEATGDCSMPPAAGKPVGWASESGGTTGGGTSSPMMITSFAALTAAAAGSTPATLWIKGSLTGDLTVGSNKTLIGLCGAELHGHVELSGSANVIVRNLKIVGYAVGNCALDPSYKAAEGCSSGQDAMSIQNNAHHIWIDHCDISDGTDGNLDITNGANYITVSWTKFHYTPRSDNAGSDSTGAAGHRFSNLIGGTDSPKQDDAHTLNVTWHHDWWADNVVERQPRVRFGKNHLFNNLWSSTQSNYCVRAGKQAQLLLEAGVFDGVASPQVFNNSTDQGTASITAKDNVYTNTSGTQATGGGGTPFTQPPYMYTVDSTDGLADIIRKQAGPR